MGKPFTFLVAVLLLVIAAVQAARALTGFDVVIGGHLVPILASWIACGVAFFLSLMVFAEMRR